LYRLTDILPVRSVRFFRNDSLIGLTKAAGRETMASFAYNADVSYTVVVALSLCLPVVVVSTLHIVHIRRFYASATIVFSPSVRESVRPGVRPVRAR